MMNKKAVLVIGLPGSGKTHYLVAHLTGYFHVDDPKPTTNISAYFKYEKLAIADPNLCIPATRQRAMQMLREAGYKVKCVYFENNVQACLNNVQYRKTQGDQRSVALSINMFAKAYTIPGNAMVMKIWQKV